MASDYTEDQLAHKTQYVAYLVQREIVLSVAGMNGISDSGQVTPAWLSSGGSKGVSRAAAKSIMVAIKLKLVKAGALAVLPLGLDEIERLAR